MLSSDERGRGGREAKRRQAAAVQSRRFAAAARVGSILQPYCGTLSCECSPLPSDDAGWPGDPLDEEVMEEVSE